MLHHDYTQPDLCLTVPKFTLSVDVQAYVPSCLHITRPLFHRVNIQVDVCFTTSISRSLYIRAQFCSTMPIFHLICIHTQSPSCMYTLFVFWLLNVPATCECISGTDLLRQFNVLQHWDRSCRSIFYLTQSQYTDTRPTSPSTDRITPGPGRVASGVPIFESLVWLDHQKKNPGTSGIRTRDLPLSRRTPYHLANEAVYAYTQAYVLHLSTGKPDLRFVMSK